MCLHFYSAIVWMLLWISQFHSLLTVHKCVATLESLNTADSCLTFGAAFGDIVEGEFCYCIRSVGWLGKQPWGHECRASMLLYLLHPHLKCTSLMARLHCKTHWLLGIWIMGTLFAWCLKCFRSAIIRQYPQDRQWQFNLLVPESQNQHNYMTV